NSMPGRIADFRRKQDARLKSAVTGGRLAFTCFRRRSPHFRVHVALYPARAMPPRVPPPRFIADLTAEERRLFRRLRTPGAVQDYLDRIPINFEPDGQTCRSPRGVLRAGVAHCLEAALLAAAAFWFHGRAPLLLDLK